MNVSVFGKNLGGRRTFSKATSTNKNLGVRNIMRKRMTFGSHKVNNDSNNNDNDRKHRGR